MLIDNLLNYFRDKAQNYAFCDKAMQNSHLKMRRIVVSYDKRWRTLQSSKAKGWSTRDIFV